MFIVEEILYFVNLFSVYISLFQNCFTLLKLQFELVFFILLFGNVILLSYNLGNITDEMFLLLYRERY